MNLVFNVDYQTRFGEDIMLNLIEDGTVKKHRMSTVDGLRWSFQWQFSGDCDVLNYYYLSLIHI